jgi:hypothetical protein
MENHSFSINSVSTDIKFFDKERRAAWMRGLTAAAKLKKLAQPRFLS